MLDHFRFYSSKSSPFRVKYLGSDYCEIDEFAYRKFQKGMLRLETTKVFIHIVFRYKLTVFRDSFGRFTLVCSFFDKIAEGPDSFCHHCRKKKKYFVGMKFCCASYTAIRSVKIPRKKSIFFQIYFNKIGIKKQIFKKHKVYCQILEVLPVILITYLPV